MRFNKYIAIALILLTVAGACKKDDSTASTADPFYEVAVDGYTVTFNNTTSGATSYKWEFGDGESSTEQSPVHTYPGKGKYVPTLYATDAKGKVTEASTVIRIGKASSIKLDDNSFADWDTVTTNAVTPAAGETYFKQAKFDYDGNYVYCYFEVNASQSNGTIYDFYIDTDNSTTTGLLTGNFPDGGYDVLLEGSIMADWLDPFVFAGATQADFSWSGAGITEFYTVGTDVTEGTTRKFEMRLARTKIKGMAAATAIRIGMTATKSDWSVTYGYLPGASKAPVSISFE